MPDRRKIDERDIDRILAALTNTQIASLYGMCEIEVFRLRRARQAIRDKTDLSRADDDDRLED